MTAKKIIEISIKNFNKNNKRKDQLVYTDNLQILGPKSKMDSLKVVNFFIEVENHIKKNLIKILIFSMMVFLKKVINSNMK